MKSIPLMTFCKMNEKSMLHIVGSKFLHMCQIRCDVKYISNCGLWSRKLLREMVHRSPPEAFVTSLALPPVGQKLWGNILEVHTCNSLGGESWLSGRFQKGSMT